MKKPSHSPPAPRRFSILALWALSLLGGCGKLHSWYTQAQAQSDREHSVILNWTASKSLVAGYNVYRLSPSAEPIKVSQGIVVETRYVDKHVEAGQMYSYYVKSVDFRGIESKPSETITVTVPTGAGPPANH